METLLDEIRNNQSIDQIQQLKNSLFDCAKILKSNDETFNISTFDGVRDKFVDLMSQYVDTIQELEAAQRTFTHLQENVKEDDRAPNGGEPVDLDQFRLLFDQTLKKEMEDSVTGESEAQVMLGALIYPANQQHRPSAHGDEEIYVEQDGPKEIPKDPITKKNIKIAVKSKKCHHVYDQESIKSYIELKERNKSKVQCPVAGCSNKNLKLAELILDDTTNALIASLM